MSEIQTREEANDEPIDLAKCYSDFSDKVNKHIEDSVEASNVCLTTSETARNTLQSDETKKNALETKIETLKALFDGCSDKEVDTYFDCHDKHVRFF